MKIKLAILLMTLFLFSCQKKEEQKATPSLPHPKEILVVPDSITSKSVFVSADDTGFTRVWVKSNESKNRYYYSDTLNILKVTRYQWEGQNTFKINKEIVLLRTEWTTIDIDSTQVKTEKINNVPYLYLTMRAEYMGNAITESAVNFIMINTQNITDQYALMYDGMHSDYCEDCIRGEFAQNKKLDKNKLFKDKLYAYAKNTKYIYQASKEEKSLSFYKNFDKKWEKDNGQDNHFGAGTGEIPEKIKSTYYKENLFALTQGTTDIVENENYKIQSVFRGNLVGYNKKKKLYFPIMVESCTLSCNKTITFANPTTINITYEDESKSVLDLSTILFRQ